MAILYDYHLHSSFSGDSMTPMQDMIEAALSKGLSGLCITEHFDLDFPVCEQCPEGTFSLDFPAYHQHFLEMKKLYQYKILLCFGIELGLQPHLAQTHYDLLKEYPFDFVIGSAHVCHSKDPYYPAFYEGRSEEEAYREYFSCILENLDAYDDFDSLGHLDYVVRYGPNKDTYYSYDRYRDLLDPILIKLISMGKALECNTGAIYHGLRSLNPSIDVFKRYRALGGELVTIGSDAHKPDALAKGLDTARALLQDCGFTHYATFQNRTACLHKL